MVKYEKIIFVCTGNTCRSPMAETIYHQFETNSKLKVLSRGLVVLFPEPVNPKANIVLHNHGLSLDEHVSTQLDVQDMSEETLVLTMTEKQRNTIREDYGFFDNVYTIKEFVGESGDVTDPYGATLVEYEDCYVELARLVKKTVYKLNEEEEDYDSNWM